MDLPFDPQIIIFIVFLAIGFLKNILEKGKQGQDTSHFPTDRDARPARKLRRPKKKNLGDFKRMIEEVKRKATEIKRARIQPEDEDYTPNFIDTTPEEEPYAPDNDEAPVVTQVASADLSLTALLRSPASARQAIILKEVLGEPKGF